jgi:SOS-response transcriptional repressor LexA
MVEGDEHDSGGGNVYRFQPKGTFLIRQSDNSMLLAGIRERDAVRVTRTSVFKSGDIVLVETPLGLFIRYIYRATNCGMTVLMGAHPRCPVQVWNITEVSVKGVVK